MNITASAIPLAAILATAIAAAPTAAGGGNTVIQKLGTEETLVDDGVVQNWTGTNLQPSTGPGNVAVRDRLWEATVTDNAVQGQVMPLPFRFSARTPSGANYGFLREAPSPPSLSGNYLPPGQSATGKL